MSIEVVAAVARLNTCLAYVNTDVEPAKWHRNHVARPDDVLTVLTAIALVQASLGGKS